MPTTNDLRNLATSERTVPPRGASISVKRPVWRPAGALWLALAGCGPTGTTDVEEPCDAPGTYLYERDRTCYCTAAGTKACAGPFEGEGDDGSVSDPIPYGSGTFVRAVFVVDSSPGMATIQREMARGAGALVEALAAERIVLAATVVSADGGTVGDACPAPERPPGIPIVESCRARLDAFAAGPDAPQDPASACTDVCDLDTLPEAIDPIEGMPFPGVVAHPDDAPDQAAALRCAIPLGNTGCPFSQPIAALDAFLDDAPDLFARYEAFNLAILVGDGDECTTRDPSIYDPNGPKTFFDDPNATSATEAVCWNAGVACEGDPAGYDACAPVDLDASGDPADADAAVLASVLDPDASVWSNPAGFPDLGEKLFVSIGGYDPGDPEGPLALSKGADPAFSSQHGIDPGCSAEGIAATPPVRMDHFLRTRLEDRGTDVMRVSACADGYEAAMQAVADRVATRRESCGSGCLYDVDPDAPGVQFVCHFSTAALDGPGSVTLPLCEDAPGADGIPEGAFACVRVLGGEAAARTCGEELPDGVAFRMELSDEALRRAPGWSFTANCIQGKLEDDGTCRADQIDPMYP
ncbi:MAG: hypothetical protein D6705_02395 [Deltaproteobacteria bacterium]|nr:MAG: hypothetical protein D6705_02395 [Deltaproteobacteria bacterium]